MQEEEEEEPKQHEFTWQDLPRHQEPLARQRQILACWFDSHTLEERFPPSFHRLYQVLDASELLSTDRMICFEPDRVVPADIRHFILLPI